MQYFQYLIDHAPMVLVGLAALVWALSQLFNAMAKRNGPTSWWALEAPRVKWAADGIATALDWLQNAGYWKGDGASKLAELNKQLEQFEKLCSQGKDLEAIAFITGFQRAAMDKLEKSGAALLPSSTPLANLVRQSQASTIAAGLGSTTIVNISGKSSGTGLSKPPVGEIP